MVCSQVNDSDAPRGTEKERTAITGACDGKSSAFSALLHSRLMAVYGVWQRDVESGGEVRHLIAQRLVDLTPLLGGLATQSREFH